MSNGIAIRDEKSLVAVAKSVLSKALDLQPGTRTFDVSLNIKGEVTKGEDYEQVVAQSVCPYTLLAVALDKLNANTSEAVTRLVAEVSAMSDKERSEMRSSMKEATQNAMSSLGDSAVRLCAGKTTSKIDSVQLLAQGGEGGSFTAADIAVQMGLSEESANA